MPKYPWIEFPLLFLMVVGPLMIIGSRSGMSPDPDSERRPIRVKGIGVRVIQLIALLVLLPMAGILGLEEKMSGDGVGALIGVAIGYTLSGVERPVPKRNG
jgi:hypothetical protein